MADTAASKKIFDGRYEILSIIGRGSCSVVYHARHVDAPHSEVALKVLLNRRELLARGQSLADSLRQEALALVSSRHRYVVRLDDFHSVGDLCYLSLEYAPLLDIRKLITSRDGRLPAVQAERFMTQAAEALAFLHKAGIIHRDIKPDNILVMNEREIRLADFGVAVLPGDLSDLEDLRRGVGTMDYMAPEVLDGTRSDERSDVYALGVTFYEAASGIHPFADAPLAEQLTRRRDGSFTDIRALNPEISPALAAIIMRAMSYDADARFGSGRELHQALQDLREVKAAPPPPASEALGATQSQSLQSSGSVASAVGATPAAPDYSSELPRSVQDLLDALERELPAEPNGHAGAQHSEPDPFSDDTDYTDDYLDDMSDSAFDEESPSAPEPMAAAVGDAPLAPAEQSPVIGLEQQAKPVDELMYGSGTHEVTPFEPAPERHPADQTFSSFLGEASQPEMGAQAAPPPSPASEPAQPSPVEIIPLSEGQHSIAEKLAAELRMEAESKSSVDATYSNGAMYAHEPASISETGASAEVTPDKPGTAAKEPSWLKEPPPRRPAATGLIILTLIPILAVIFFRLRGSPDVPAIEESAVTQFEGFPLYSGGPLAFPALPTGTYSGSVHGLFPGLTVPLAIISSRDRNQLTFILGLEGIRPVTVTIDPKGPPGTVRVATSGLMLSFSGEELDGELIGYVQEATTGVEAEWRARPHTIAPEGQPRSEKEAR